MRNFILQKIISALSVSIIFSYKRFTQTLEKKCGGKLTYLKFKFLRTKFQRINIIRTLRGYFYENISEKF